MCQAQKYLPLQPPIPLEERKTLSYMPLHPARTDEHSGLLGTEGFDIYPRVSAGVLYDDNVTLSGVTQFGDWNTFLSPGLTFLIGETTTTGFGAANIQGAGLTLDSISGVLGNRALVSTSRGLSLDYAAAFNFYAEHSQLNSIDHSARLNAVYPWPRLALRVEQSVAAVSETPLDAGTRQCNQSYLTLLEGTYSLSELTSLQGTLNQTISDVEQGIGSKSWQAGAFANYAVTPSINSGVGINVGLLNADRSPTQIYEQGRLRLSYLVTELVSLDASVGLERRQFDGPQSDTSSPVFNLAGTYLPTARTQFTLSANRSILNSAVLAGQNYTANTLTFGWRQEISFRLSSLIALSYNHLSYSGAGAVVQISRSDDNISLRAGLGMAWTPRLSVSTFYRFRQNVSTQTTFNYRDNQAGMSLNWAY